LAQHQLDSSVGDPLADHLLPVLVHRMNNTTQLLSNLQALGRVSETTDWLAERNEDLAGACGDMDRVGYLMAVVASASGADLLLKRRESEGLQFVMEAVADVAFREGRELQRPAHLLPLQAPHVYDGWQLPWALGSLLLLATLGLERGSRLEWQLLEEGESWVLVSSSSVDEGFHGLRERLARRLPECRLDVRREGWSWRVPADWLRARS